MSSVKDIEKVLQIILFQRRTVSLPGIGTFKIERLAPKVSESGKYQWGPVFIIRLDSKIESNSKEIFSFVSKKMNISEWEAIKLVNEFVTDLKTTVRNNSKYELDGLGSIEINDDGSFRIKSETLQYPFYSRIQKPDADLLPSQQENDWEQFENAYPAEETYEYPVEESRKSRWWVSLLVIVILSLIIIGISLTRNDIPFGGRQNRSDIQVAPAQYE